MNDGSPSTLLFALKLDAGAFVCSYQFKAGDKGFSARKPRAEGIYTGHVADLATDLQAATSPDGLRVLLRAHEVVEDKRQPIDVVLEFHRKPAVR